MRVTFVKWPDSAQWHQLRITIGKEISQASPGSCPNAVCDVSLTPDRSGVAIGLCDTPNPTQIILLLVEQCWEPGLIERTVRKALADREDPGRVERELLGGIGAES
jgi:hypothetical protein